MVAVSRIPHEVIDQFDRGSIIWELRSVKEEQMRGSRKSGNGRWHNSVQRVRFVEHKVRRRAGEPISGLMRLGERVDRAATE